MTIEEMRLRKKELGYSYQRIAELSGLPVGTVQKVLSGITKAPRHDTIRSLEAVLTDVASLYQAGEPPEGGYTLEDYYELPREKRMELIDGVLYDMAAPSIVHQVLLGELLFQLSVYIKEKGGSCIPAVSPLDVQLDRDERTMVQPDLIILCDHDKLRESVVYGAPDFVTEILSPATRRRDMCLKLAKYAGAGVREYWMIDPDREKIVVYDLERDELPQVYGFRDQVPVAVFAGDCRIDFAVIDDYVRGLIRV